MLLCTCGLIRRHSCLRLPPCTHTRRTPFSLPPSLPPMNPQPHTLSQSVLLPTPLASFSEVFLLPYLQRIIHQQHQRARADPGTVLGTAGAETNKPLPRPSRRLPSMWAHGSHAVQLVAVSAVVGEHRSCGIQSKGLAQPEAGRPGECPTTCPLVHPSQTGGGFPSWKAGVGRLPGRGHSTCKGRILQTRRENCNWPPVMGAPGAGEARS